MIEFEGRAIPTTLDEVADPRRAVLRRTRGSFGWQLLDIWNAAADRSD